MSPESFNVIAGTFNRLNCRPVVVIAGDKCQKQPLQTVDGGVSTTVSILNDNTFKQENSVKHALYKQFRILDRDYAAFVDLLQYLQPTQAQLDDFQQSVVLRPPGFLEDEEIYGALANTRHGHHDSLPSRRPKGEHHGAEAVCQPTTSDQCALCGSSWRARHLAVPWHENSNK